MINKVKETEKQQRYTFLYKELHTLISRKEEKIIYFSFEYIQDKQLIKKILYYFVSNYDINIKNNILIIYPPEKYILDEINHEIYSLSLIDRKYKINPLPLISYNKSQNEVDLNWLGVYNNQDQLKLKELLFEEFDLRKTDFIDPYSIIGHNNYFDKYGNLKSLLPSRESIIQVYNNNSSVEFYKKAELLSRINEIQISIEKNCILEDNNYIFLCLGNYYQFKYIELSKLLNNKKYCSMLSLTLFDILVDNPYFVKEIMDNDNYIYIAATATSGQLLNSLTKQGRINLNKIILIDNYYDISSLKKHLTNDKKLHYILICDIIATGSLAKRINNVLYEFGKSLDIIMGVVNTIDYKFPLSNDFVVRHQERIISLCNYPIEKYYITNPQIKPFLLNKKVKRINPYTNTEVYPKTDYSINDKIVFTKKDFLELIDYEDIYIGVLDFNNIIHPYFFNTENIIKKHGVKIFNKIFLEIKKYNPLVTSNLRIFYPKLSDIRHLDFETLKKLMKDHSISEYELERFNTVEGWKFPHLSNSFFDIINNNPVLILDDGSCSGDSLIQMINEVSCYNPDSITIISLVGRISEQKKDFFSLINYIKKNEKDNNIKLSVYWGTFWHIPTYYMRDNPFSDELSRLRHIINLPNTPYRISNICSLISKQLSPKEKNNFTNYKFFPRIKSSGKIPLKEIINVRDEVGKAIDLNAHDQDFDFFNKFILQYETFANSKERYKDIELLCAVLLYEPAIFIRIKNALPDITEKLRNFIETILWGNPLKGNQKLEIERLTYSWNERDFIHLFFIFFQGIDLYEKLKENDNFAKLLIFINNSASIDYILYKMLEFFAIDKDELDEKNPELILLFIQTVITKGVISKDSRVQLKIFQSFVTTLPHKDSFKKQLIDINDGFVRLIEAVNHKNSVSAHLGYMLSDTFSMPTDYEKLDIEEFKKSWEIISSFIEPILSLAQSYPTFFPNDIYKKIKELGEIQGRLNEQIFRINKTSDFEDIENQLLKLQNDLLSQNSAIFLLFLKHTIYDIEDCIISNIEKYDDGKNQLKNRIIIVNDIKNDYILLFPHYYLKEIIFDTIVHNLRHSENEIHINIADSSDNVIVIIENVISENINQGSGYGSILLDRAKKFPLEIFKYYTKSEGKIFKQKILIKKISNEG